MSLDYFLAYAFTVFVVVLIPGPVVMMIVSYGLSRGREAALRTVAGVTLGDFTAMTLSLSGLGAVLAASATLFTILKVAGALYLVWLGIGLLRSRPTMDAEQLNSSSRSIFWTAYWVTALNPKSITFFVAFLPQFLDRHADFWTQMVIFETTFLALAFANAFGYALVAARAREVVRNPRAIRIFNRAGGSLLVGAGVATVAMRSGN
jgi:threonine/homoserine/homoserine lactone efflux protein